MKKVILIPLKAIWFALKNEMYGFLFAVSVIIAGTIGGIVHGNMGKWILSAVIILALWGTAKAIWNRIGRIGGKTKEDVYRRIRKKEKQKEMIEYIFKS